MPRQLINLAGQTFGRLTVIRHIGFTEGGEAKWLCRCACGNTEVAVSGGNLRSGNSKSCGCYKLERIRERSITHGHTKGRIFSPEYRTWAAMMGRCRNPNRDNYRYYGGKGRDVFEPWRKAECFISYVLQHLGPKPTGMTLDRIDNGLGYLPGNIRWASWKQQANNRNKRRSRNSISA